MASPLDFLNYGGSNASDYTNGLAGWGGPSNGIANGAGGSTNFMSGLSDLFSGNSLFGGVNKNGTQSMGWATPAIGIGSAIMGGINGSKQLKLANDNFKEGVRQFDLNYGAQKQTTNTQLEDRQRARVASNPGAYESVSSYLDKNKIV